MYKDKFVPANHAKVCFTRVNCMICLETFENNDEIIEMECNDKHHWSHRDCFLEKSSTV